MPLVRNRSGPVSISSRDPLIEALGVNRCIQNQADQGYAIVVLVIVISGKKIRFHFQDAIEIK